jgi:hypothetical protein
MKDLNPTDELNRFFEAYPPYYRENVERYAEYWRAVNANDVVSAMEIAAAIMSDNLNYSQLKALFAKKFPKYSNPN